MRVYIVMPDMSETKRRALELAAGELAEPIDVMVSVLTLQRKKGMIDALRELRSRGTIGGVMLDSGGFEAPRGNIVDVREYARVASSLVERGVVDLVVAPDIPLEPDATIERTRDFARAYKLPFVPVIQLRRGDPPSTVLQYIERYIEEGILDYAPVVDGSRRLVALGGLRFGGLDAVAAARVINYIAAYHKDITIHLLGVPPSFLATMARRGARISEVVWSVDTGSWGFIVARRRRDVAAKAGGDDLAAITAYAIVDTIRRARRAADAARGFRHANDDHRLVVTSFKAPIWLIELIDNEASRRGWSRSELIRRAILQFIHGNNERKYILYTKRIRIMG